MKKLMCSCNKHGRIAAGMAIIWLAAVGLLCLALPQAVQAEGAFISAPARVDMEYDDARHTLYITNGSEVLRYDTNTNTFLSPFQLWNPYQFTRLMGIDISPDGNTLAVADKSYTSTQVWIHTIDLQTGQRTKVTFPRSFSEGGTYSVAFGNDGRLLVSSTYLGSGWVPLRRYDPATQQTTVLATISQDSMLTASADGSMIGFEQSNISDGSFGRYRVSDGNMLRKSGYTDGTGWFNYEIGVSRDGGQYALPTYGGCFICDSNLVKYNKIGVYASGQPIGVVYHPTKDIVYFAWATTTKVRAYNTTTLTQIAEYDFQNMFDHPGNHAFVEGRLKMSQNGKMLFATVQGGVRYITLNKLPVANAQTVSALEDKTANITLTGSDADGDSLTYTVVSGPSHGTLSGSAPNLVYTPAANYNGSDYIEFKVNDGTGDSATAGVSISVAAVNDAPSFNLSVSSIFYKHKKWDVTMPGIAKDMNPGPADESAQTVSFTVTTDRPDLFSAQPAIDPTGTLTFTLDKGKGGNAVVTVRASDNGGTANGGVDTSAPQSFVITNKD